MQCLQKTLTWVFFYSIRFTIDLHSKSLFVEILYPMLYPLIFNLENLLSFWKRTSDLKTVELIVFIWVGSGILRRPMEVQPAKSKQYQMLPRTWFFILKTSRIDLKKIEGKKKSEMKWDTVWSIEVKVKLRTKVIKDISDIECRSRSQPCWSSLIKKESWNSGKLRDKIATQKCRI